MDPAHREEPTKLWDCLNICPMSRGNLKSSSVITCTGQTRLQVVGLRGWCLEFCSWRFGVFFSSSEASIYLLKSDLERQKTAPGNRGFVLLKEDHSNMFLCRLVICVCQACTVLPTVSGINRYRIQAVFVLSHSHIPAINFWITPVPHLMKKNGLNKGISSLVLQESNSRRQAHHTCLEQ